jgi:Predicted ATPase (AAA+ superfamily)
MLYRKIQPFIESYLKSDSNKVLIIDGARQIGKTYIIRHVGRQLFENYIELNFAEDQNGLKLFAQVRTVQDFYFQVSTIAGEKMGEKKNTLIFLDEIQAYPHLLTMLKFLKEDDRFTYIASGSLLGVTLKKTSSIPMGSIELKRMFPLDFEEFLLANGFNRFAIDMMHEKFLASESLDAAAHEKVMDLFKKYLLIGGLPDAINTFIADTNIVKVRTIHRDIRAFYADDASKYEVDNNKKLKIRRIYEMIPSNMGNKKKRVVFQEIEDKRGKRFSDYQDEFEYLISAGIALDVNAISTPVFPLTQAVGKNLLKLYLNDVGLLTDVLYGSNIRAILDDETGINLGSVYESVVAQELAAHSCKLFYYDNRSKGEVDFLIDDYDNLSAVPIEVKSGKDYTIHSALSAFVKNEDYHVKKAYVLSNTREITTNGKITYLPIYDVMFLGTAETNQELFPL